MESWRASVAPIFRAYAYRMHQSIFFLVASRRGR